MTDGCQNCRYTGKTVKIGKEKFAVMMHPSYIELMNVVNEGSTEENPVVRSRYSIVIAAAKRARQLIDHPEEATIETEKDEKPLSVAVEELYEGTVKILPEDDTDDDDEHLFFTEEEMEEVEEKGTAYEEEERLHDQVNG